MDRTIFELRLQCVHQFVADCETEAKEIVKRNGGIVHVKSLMDSDSYYFIDKEENAKFLSVRVDDDKLVIEIETEYSGTYDIDFTEATWDLVMLSDLMSALYDIDGQESKIEL